MSQNDRDNRTPIERLIRIGWDALDNARREPLTLDKVAQNTRDMIETARKGIFDETSLKSFTFVAPLDNAAAADIDLELSVGESYVYALDASDPLLIDADLNYLGALSFGVTGDVQRSAFLRQSTPLTVGWANPVNWTTRPTWNIGLTRKLPMDVRVQGGVGDADVNLSGLKLQSVRVEGNIGRMNITLGTQSSRYKVSIRGGAGPIALNIPAGAGADVNVRGGVGGLLLNIEPNAAVQLNVNGGVGRTVMKPGFRRMEATAPGLPNTGVWETVDYHAATRQVRVNVAEGMVGNLTVRVLPEAALPSGE